MNQNACRYCEKQEWTDYFLNNSVYLHIIIMKYVICLGFNQEYFWIHYCRGACAIDMAEENPDKFPEGIGLTVSWLWLWFHIFSFCCESLKNTLMRSVSSYAEISENSNIYSCGMIYVISLAEGFLLSIYWVGWCVILFKSHPTWLIWPQISCLQRDIFFSPWKWLSRI